MKIETVRQQVHFEAIRDVGKLRSLKSDWDSLCHRSADYNFSQSFQWSLANWNIIGNHQGRQLYCLAGWAGSRLVLIWPFVLFRRGLWLVLHPLGLETTEYCGVLVEDDPEAEDWVAQAWQKLRPTCGSDIIILPRVRRSSRLHRIVSQEQPMSAWVSPISSVSWDEYQEWESYYRALHRDFRHSLRRSRRRLAERGNLSFEVVTKHEQFPLIIDWLFSHKTEWLNRMKRRSPWQDAEQYKKLLITVAAEGERRGEIVLFVLKFDGEIISAVLCRIAKSNAEAIVAAFGRAYSKYGPGQLLYEDILKWAFERRLEFDFRIGNEPYKKPWTNRGSEVITYRFVNSIWGKTFSLASRCRSRLRSFRLQFSP